MSTGTSPPRNRPCTPLPHPRVPARLNLDNPPRHPRAVVLRLLPFVCRYMALSMAGIVASSFASFDLVNVVTGVVLYTTCATESEIKVANANLRTRGLQSRFVKHGTFSVPNLHAA